MNKLRVALLGPYSLDTVNIRGGVQAAGTYLIRGLAKNEDLELHILTIKPSDWTGPDKYIQSGVNIHFLPSYPHLERLRFYSFYQSSVNRLLTQIKPAVVHTQEASADAFVAIRSGYPTIVTVHGIHREDAKYFHSFGKRLRFYFDSFFIEKKIMRQVKYLIAISQYVTEYFSPLLRPDLHVEFIPNAVDECFFDLNSSSSKQVVLFVGRLIPRKRILDLIKAFSIVYQQVPDAELHIAGEMVSEPAYVKIVQDEIIHHGLRESIHLLGQLNQPDLLHEYQNCAMVVLPSVQETTPMVLAQAMAAGKPVIATRVGGVPEMLGLQGERGILVNVGDVNGLSKGIEELLKNPEKRLLMGQAGHEYALHNFHLDRIAQQTYNFYRFIFEKEQRKHE